MSKETKKLESIKDWLKSIKNKILNVQEEKKWGTHIVDNLFKELKTNFPETTGLSLRNLKYRRSFASEYPKFPFVQVSLAQIIWYYHISLLMKIKERFFYIVDWAKSWE